MKLHIGKSLFYDYSQWGKGYVLQSIWLVKDYENVVTMRSISVQRMWDAYILCYWAEYNVKKIITKCLGRVKWNELPFLSIC